MDIWVPSLGQSQSVDCDCLPGGSVGVLGCDWEQQVSPLDYGQLTWPDVRKTVVIVVIRLGQSQAVDCDCWPWGSAGALGCD